MLFRVSPELTFSDEFEVSDQPFCDAEIRAIWLAALNLDSVLAVNKYDAMTWFEGSSWPVWRRKVIHVGIPVSKFLFGDASLTHMYGIRIQVSRLDQCPATTRKGFLVQL